VSEVSETHHKSLNTIPQFIKLMDSETPYKALPLPVFDGENYHIWAARMEAHLEENDLWEAVEEDYEVLPFVRQSNNGSDKKSQGKESKKVKRKSFFVCCCLRRNLHQNYDHQINI